jgi:hypothetical protein
MTAKIHVMTLDRALVQEERFHVPNDGWRALRLAMVYFIAATLMFAVLSFGAVENWAIFVVEEGDRRRSADQTRSNLSAPP